jgi:hypothetical protein
MIAMFGLIVKLVKWLVIAVAYVLVGLVKLVTILVVLVFFTSRAAIRRLFDARNHRTDDEDEYDLGYPSYVGRSSERLTQDAFDARWQRERDLRVAQRRVDGADRRGGLPTVPPDHRTVDEKGNAAVLGAQHGSFGPVTATANGLVHHETREHRWKASDRTDPGARVIRP